MEYCRLHRGALKKSKINGHFPKLDENFPAETTYLHKAYKYAFEKKADKTMEKVETARKKLNEISKLVAIAIKLPPIKGQPGLNKYVTLKT